jgi:ferredoxin
MVNRAPSSYQILVRRLNKHPQGAPPSKLLYDILRLIFSEKEARLVGRLPMKVFTEQTAGQLWGMDTRAARKALNDLCDRALVIDMVQNGRTLYCLPPPMAGFFEFSLMRARRDINQKTLADLFYRYINQEHDFAQELFARGETQLGRVFVNESEIPDRYRLSVLDNERASHVIRSATAIGVSQCYCRNKMRYLAKACDAPLDICLTFNWVAESLIRHGHARPVDAVEATDILQVAYAANLVQFGENVREEVNFICNCCKCCCEGMIAARRFAAFHPVNTTAFLAAVNPHECIGCGKCTAVCPVEAIEPVVPADTQPGAGPARPYASVDRTVCLGCGLCSRVCPTGAVRLLKRAERVITPLNTAHRVVAMAIERNKLHHVLFDNQVFFSHRAMAAFLGVLFKMPPIKQALASKQLKSRYLEGLVKKMKWQPTHPAKP